MWLAERAVAVERTADDLAREERVRVLVAGLQRPQHAFVGVRAVLLLAQRVQFRVVVEERVDVPVRALGFFALVLEVADRALADLRGSASAVLGWVAWGRRDAAAR
ncbi:MAG: hypothetical protein ABR510_10455 [Trueperaceae bacterium]